MTGEESKEVLDGEVADHAPRREHRPRTRSRVSAGQTEVTQLEAFFAGGGERRGNGQQKREPRRGIAPHPEKHPHRDRRPRTATHRGPVPPPGRRRSSNAPVQLELGFRTCPSVPTRSATIIANAPTTSAPAATPGVRRHVFDEIAEQEADDHDRNGPDGDEAINRLDVVGGRRKQRGQRSRHGRELGVEVSQDRRERADVQRHVEGQTELGRRLPAEEKPRQDQVRGARDRKKLGQSLNDAEQDRQRVTSPARVLAATRRAGGRASRGAVGGGRRAPAPSCGLRPCNMIAIAGRDEHGRIRAADDADEHREGEALQHLATEEIERDHAQQAWRRR